MKILLTLALLLSITTAFAMPPNWLLLGENERANVLVDSHNVQKPYGYVKFWTLLEYKAPQQGGWSSEKRLFLYSCKDHSLVWQQSMYYAGSMTEGELIDVRTLNRFSTGIFIPADTDPTLAITDPGYKKAVPESAYLSVFNSMC